MPAALFFSPQILSLSYGVGHPFQIERLADMIRLCAALDLLSGANRPLESREASFEEIARFHDPDYVDALRRAPNLTERELAVWGIGAGDNPCFPGLWQACRWIAGGSLAAARWIHDRIEDEEPPRAFHPAGGLHHAMRSRASGFCYVNDPVLAIGESVAKGHRVCYVDVDAHHGDGVQAAFYDTDRVLTISIHQDGRTIFPGTGFPNEAGRGLGRGYAVNVPLLPGASDAEYDLIIEEVLRPVVDRYDPDLLVTQIGLDALRDDPLALLDWTLSGLDRFLHWAAGTNRPWLALGGGGYRRWNVIRGWSLVWARMLGVEFPPRRPEADPLGRLPESWPHELFDEPPPRNLTEPAVRMRHLRQGIAVVRENLFEEVER